MIEKTNIACSFVLQIHFGNTLCQKTNFCAFYVLLCYLPTELESSPRSKHDIDHYCIDDASLHWIPSSDDHSKHHQNVWYWQFREDFDLWPPRCLFLRFEATHRKHCLCLETTINLLFPRKIFIISFFFKASAFRIGSFHRRDTITNRLLTNGLTVSFAFMPSSQIK